MDRTAHWLLRLQLLSLLLPIAAGGFLAACRNPPQEHEGLVAFGLLLILAPWLYFTIVYFPAEVKRTASQNDLNTDPRLLAWIRTAGLMAFLSLAFFGDGDRSSLLHTVRFGFLSAGAFVGFHLLLLRAMLQGAQSHRDEYLRGRRDAVEERATVPVSE